MSKDTTGPAFPYCKEADEAGLTKREYAMIHAPHARVLHIRNESYGDGRGPRLTYEQAARKYADALLAEAARDDS